MPSKHNTVFAFQLGADPELFLRNVQGQFVSAHDLLPGTKREPHKVPHGAIQVDGTAAEFNIDPAQSGSQFVQKITSVINTLKGHLNGHELIFEPTVTYDPLYFATLPDHAKELGCSPDWNAWTGLTNPTPDGSKTTMRSAGGHLHYGFHNEKGVDPDAPFHVQDCCEVIKQMDYHLGLFSLWWDKDNSRRSLYGKAGAHRRKSYGVEYRSLSNKWLKSSHLQAWIWSASQVALNQLVNSDSMETKFGNFAQVCIDDNITDWQDREVECTVGDKLKTIKGSLVRAYLKVPNPPMQGLE